MDIESATVDLNLMCCSGLDLKAISENVTILEEGLKLCPLCQSEVKYIFINFAMKMMTCENMQCTYPFGHEEPENIFFKVERDSQFEDDMSIITSSTTAMDSISAYCTTDTESVFSEVVFSEATQSRTELETDTVEVEETHDITAVCSEVKQNKNNKYTKLKENKIAKSHKAQMLNNMKKLGKLNREMLELNRPNKRCLKNEKWLKKLMQMQSYTRNFKAPLLRPGEMKFLKEKKTVLGLGELAIHVDTSDNSIPSITVEISGDS